MKKHSKKHSTGITEVVMILDGSGSMSPLKSDTIGGFNDLIAQQRAVPGKVNISCVMFNHEVYPIYDRLPLDAVPALTEKDYRTTGSTALLDAVGASIERMVTIQKQLPESLRAEKVLFAITTDGMENASRRFSLQQVRKMIEREQSEYGWEFLFLGANIDAVETAGEMGIHADHAVNYHADSKGTRTNYRALNDAISETRCCSEAPLSARWRADVDEDFLSRQD